MPLNIDKANSSAAAADLDDIKTATEATAVSVDLIDGKTKALPQTWTSKPQLIAIGATATQVTATPTSASRGIIFQVPIANANTIYLGGSDVSATGSTTGLAMVPGGSAILLEMADASTVYGIAAASGSNLIWAVL